jgi:aminoglycoside 6'-N-acetyltransferase I
MIVRPVEQQDAAAWGAMRHQLGPAATDEHAKEIARFFGGVRINPAETLIAVEESAGALGFVELSIRGYAEGCSSERVAYVEGWFVVESKRGKGVGAALIKAAEGWARPQGCTELASDTEIGNQVSAAAHEALGFAEVERIICYRKQL